MGFIADLFSSPGDKLPSNNEMLEYMRSDRIGANPNVNSRYGSTNVQWDGDQATITQQLSPEYDQLANMQLAYLQGGPQQLGNYSNPSLENLFSSFANRVGNRGGGMGYDVGGLSQPQQQVGPSNGLPQVGGGVGPTQQAPTQQPMPQPPIPQGGGNLGGGGPIGGGGNGGDFENMFNQWFMRQNPPIDYQTRR